MNITNEQYQRICRFLDAEMSMQEMKLFEVELENNASMREQLDFEQSLRQTYFNKKENKQPVVSINKSKWLFAAAASIIVVVLTIFLWQKKPQQNNNTTKKDNSIKQATKDTINEIAKEEKNIFNTYYTKAAIPKNAPILLAEALADYENNNYEKLLALNENNIPETRGDDAVNSKERIMILMSFYKGVAYVERNNYIKAIEYLTLCNKQNKFSNEKNMACWYLALAYLKVDTSKAKTLLQAIANNKENEYYKKAIDLLKEL